MRETQQQIDNIQIELDSFQRWGVRYLTSMLGEDYVEELMNSVNESRKEIVNVSNFKFLK